MGAWILFAGLLALMVLHSKATHTLGVEQREIRDRLSRIETQLTMLAKAMDATNQTLGSQVEEAAINAAVAAHDEAAERELVPDTRTPTQVLDEAA